MHFVIEGDFRGRTRQTRSGDPVQIHNGITIGLRFVDSVRACKRKIRRRRTRKRVCKHLKLDTTTAKCPMLLLLSEKSCKSETKPFLLARPSLSFPFNRARLHIGSLKSLDTKCEMDTIQNEESTFRFLCSLAFTHSLTPRLFKRVTRRGILQALKHCTWANMPGANNTTRTSRVD